MDDGVFVNSLSFLKRSSFETNSWPPQLPSFIPRSLLSDFYLSVEIPRNGPVLLNKDDDPSIFLCDLALLEPRIESSNQVSVGVALFNDVGTLDSSMRQSPPSSPDKKGNVVRNMELILRIEKEHCFSIDSSRISNVVRKEEHNNDNTLGSILVEIREECALRFFRTNAVSKLQEVYDTLKQFPRVAPHRSLELQSYDDAEKSTKESLSLLQKGWDGTVDFFFSLQQHENSNSKLCERLNSSASSLVYASPLELECASTLLDAKLNETQTKIDMLLASYFPSAKQRAKNRLQETPIKNGIKTNRSPKEAVALVKSLVSEKDRILHHRYQLSFLPER
mmetsp:Transcript_24425/g.36246  ORF Transcript_24425/g.36246 Transcript_24425/m.36246 type:complete len:336 (+) Transcript_24425:15-1022(+)